MKFEGSGSKGTRVIERKRSVTDGQTDRRIDGQTDRRTRQKQYVSPRGGRHKYVKRCLSGNKLYIYFIKYKAL